jgi:hypothetical protein
MPQRPKKTRGKVGKKMSNRRLASFREASERTGVSYWALWRGAEAGFFKTIYLGGRRMIPESELAHIEEYGFGGRKRRPHQKTVEPAEARA